MVRFWCVALSLVSACTLGGGVGARRQHEVLPELVRDDGGAVSWHASVVALRTTLGRSGIRLRVGGVDKRLTGDAISCELVDPEAPVPRTLIDELAGAVARYPTALLDRANIGEVVLCRELTLAGSQVGGLASTRTRQLFVSIDVESAQLIDDGLATIHHEMFHMLDSAGVDDPEWTALNPAGFGYRGRYQPALDLRPVGFINRYATTTVSEDRASVFQFLMANPQALCDIAANDPIVAAKARVIVRRIADVTDAHQLFTGADCLGT